MLYMTSTTLIDAIKRKALLPNNQSTFTNADFLAFANEELQIGVVPSLMILHEEYFVYKDVVTMMPNQVRYTIPYRAIGGKLRDLFYQDLGGTLHEMTRVSPNDKAYYQTSHLQNRYIAYYIEGNDIVILPTVSPQVTGTLIFTYFLRPNELVEQDRVAIVQSISVGATTTTYTVDAVPTGMTSTTLVDLLQTKPGHKTRKFDISPSQIIGSTQIVFNNSDLLIDPIVNQTLGIPVAMEAGDQICFAGECFVPQIPTDLHSVLAQRVAARCLEALGDQQGLQAANVKLEEMEQKTGTIADNRVGGSIIKVTNFGGLLRTSRVRRRGWI
jgi:hypothetical protein